jgi:hypothetical protein
LHLTRPLQRRQGSRGLRHIGRKGVEEARKWYQT